MKQLNPRSGFTLIEIIIVVVILGILAAVALPRLTENINKAKAAEAFQIGAALGRAFDRCLADETGGAAAPTAANVGNCNSFAKVNMTAPPVNNFASWLVGSGAVTTNLLFTAATVAAGADYVVFTYDGLTGQNSKGCGGIFTKMCK